MSTLGIIFTDTCVLADKYGCRRQEILNVINAYIRGCVDRGVEWQLVDVGGHDFDYIFSKDISWQGYSRALADNCAGMGWHTDCNTPLLIIGGDDVIPVPIVTFPVINPKGETELSRLEVDLYYCFAPYFDLRKEFDGFSGKEYQKDELYNYFLSRAVFNVSRLPLERGDIPTSVTHDLGGYFERCLATGGTINIDSLLPTTAFQWHFSTQLVVENMPLLPLGPSNGVHIGNLFSSPLLRMDDRTSINEYLSALGKADMLLFNMHGHSTPEYTGFFGESIDYSSGNIEQPLAFDIPLLQKCKAKVLNTEACFGARYTAQYEGDVVRPYSRSQSMLLSALYDSDVLLYTGACESSYYDLPIIKPSDNVDNLRLTSLVDGWLKIFLHLQMQGEPVGLAMLKSKLRYFVEYADGKDWRHVYTLLEINQFGDTTLRLRVPRYNRALVEIRNKKASAEKAEVVVAAKEKYTPVYSRTSSLPELDAAYADVRASVDTALMQLSNDLRRMLADDYRYPTQHLYLTAILREENTGGHLFVYAHEWQGKSDRGVYIRVDASGKVENMTCKL